MKNTMFDEEFDTIYQEYQRYADYDENKEKVVLEFLVDPIAIDVEHDFLNEISKYLNEGHVINNRYCHNLREYFIKIRKKGLLTAESLYSFIAFFNTVKLYRDAFAKRTDLVRVNDLVLDLYDFSKIEYTISRSILPDYTVADEASSELANVRAKIRREMASIERVHSSLVSQFHQYLTSDALATKNGLPVLPVKNTFRSRVKGVVEEVSNSGETYFIVPIEILDINNRIYVLKEKEKAEEEKVLRHLSDTLYTVIDKLEKSYEIGLRLDGLIASVNFGNSYGGAIAKRDEEVLRLEDLTHLLLDVPNPVSNTVELKDATTKIMVVTGPNAGGKTVLLKSVSLAAKMNQYGLFVPTKGGAILPTFDEIIFIGGDNQSLSENLSTFSGHLHNLNQGLRQVSGRSLLLFDELGQGTAPLDGEALALSVIDYIIKLGSFAIVTSHFDRIKDRAVDDSKLLPAAMIFDEELIAPTFKLRSGSVGKSYALSVAHRIGFVEEIVTKATEYLREFNDTPEKRTIEQLTDSLNKAKETEERVITKEKELERLIQKRQNAIDSLNREKQALNEKAQKAVDKIIEERIEELDKIWNPKDKVTNLPEVSRIKGALRQQNVEEKTVVAKKVTFNVGDYVKVEKANSNGRIVSQSGTSYKVNCGGLTIKCDASDLVKLADPDQKVIKKQKTHSIDRFMSPKTGVGLECNLIGMRVEEALEKMSKYLDDCILMGYHQVRIIHGVGTGALRTAVRQFLDRYSHTDTYRFGGEGEGGVGATVVFLK